MAADKSPAFQFYPRDFLSSDAVSLMTNEQIGAYTLLLCHAWLRPEGLPASMAALAKLARCAPRRFEQTIWPALRECFDQGESGEWRNGRLEEEREKQAEFRQAASRAGKRSAEQRAFNARSRSVDVSLQRTSNGNSTLLSSSASSSASTPPKEQEGYLPPTPLAGGRDGRAGWLWAEWCRLMQDTRGISLPVNPKAGDIAPLEEACRMVPEDDRLIGALERFMHLSAEQAKAMNVKVITPATFRTALTRLLEPQAAAGVTARTSGNTAALAAFVANGRAS